MKTLTYHLENGQPVTLEIDTSERMAFAHDLSEALRDDGSLSKEASSRLIDRAHGLGLSFYEKASALLKALRYDYLVKTTA